MSTSRDPSAERSRLLAQITADGFSEDELAALVELMVAGMFLDRQPHLREVEAIRALADALAWAPDQARDRRWLALLEAWRHPVAGAAARDQRLHALAARIPGEAKRRTAFAAVRLVTEADG